MCGVARGLHLMLISLSVNKGVLANTFIHSLYLLIVLMLVLIWWLHAAEV